MGNALNWSRVERLKDRLNRFIEQSVKQEKAWESFAEMNQLAVHQARRALGELSAGQREGGPAWPLHPSSSGPERGTFENEHDFVEALLRTMYGDSEITVVDAHGKRWQPVIEIHWAPSKRSGPV